MLFNDFNTILQYMGDDSHIYVVTKDLKCHHASEYRDIIMDVINEKYINRVLRADVNFSQKGVCSLQSLITKQRVKANSFLVSISIMSEIASEQSLNLNKLVLQGDVVVKSRESINAQVQRKKDMVERIRIKKKVISDNYSDIKGYFYDWINNTDKELKIKATKYEVKIYNRLKRTFGNKVSAQHPFVINGKPYFADICIKAKHIIIEVDGGYHYTQEQQIKDKQRDEAFASIGYKTIRIPNEKARDGHFLNLLVKELLEIPDIEREKNKLKKHKKAKKKESC